MKSSRRSDCEISSLVVFAHHAARKFGRIGHHEPEDIAQIALVRAFKHKGMEVSKSYLYVVVRNAAYDAGRRAKRENELFIPADASMAPFAVCELGDDTRFVNLRGNHNVEEDDERDLEMLSRLKEAFAQLTKPLRMVLALSAQGLTYEQIASVTGVNVGTVRSRLHTARRRVRALLRDSA